ncbi:hypothetical protein HGRIS_000981 [Hohenbuehelia grisea]|uniref:HIT domain-containing protein n=1 Tax=Hohenbuehelia grisea TaxID=104357 RepID=A0ABR3IQB9_9AGAR
MPHFLTGWSRCLGFTPQKSRFTSESDGRDSEREKACIFCAVSVENGFDIVWENQSFVAFRDHRPAALHHIQLIPRTHIESVKALSKADIQLAQEMEEIGHHILDELGVARNMRRLGFHIPPFNTVSHLHLHVQALPYNSFWRRLKYPVISAGGTGKYQKGPSWFAEVGQVIRILERDGRVGALWC